ncbi:circularly permuted type 2 ATP-grasp protein [Achromobacter spanius]|uniref:circularly permuted type 2 ATP-grasp protein n=1 Tax=Achromobacter spanius TaxID=217203 RepID=UPI00222652C6|nr:circularly permuted type 2 ATP-grasp protein [Achromobacter spanius]MCW3152794.1 circularly permuted type 2 ATP-grasp protein [Achromobacter spanius]
MPQFLFQTDPSQDVASLAVHAALPARPGHYDELRAPAEASGAAASGAVASGAVASGATRLREPWPRFFELLGTSGFADLDRRVDVVARQIRENGITYNIYADANGSARPWSLDLLPFVINDTDWSVIEQGLRQRATLLNRILGDVYGPQTLLADKLIPPALVFGHPGYLRPLRGYLPPGGTYLHIAAFDLARASDGNWWVVSQRTQAPSGLGYLLENRLTISGMFPEAFKELRVQHLATSYRRLMDMLYKLSPGGSSAQALPHTPPRIVLLTPGPYNETYFEQTYLARYLGITLVEGGDLVVRDQMLYLKTLHGLERVHAVLRRLDDDFCDPLELRSDSTLGVPGLLQVMRAGNVLVANSLGTSFLESPAINGFLPAISRHLFDADLLLPSLPSWWCGEAAAREQVLANLPGTVVKSTYPNNMRGGFEPVIGGAVPPSEHAALQARIADHPDAYTIQQYLPLSQAPSWSAGHIVPRAAMLRVFVIADGEGGWNVLPGGLTRIASREKQIVSMQRGGSSMDTWVTTRGAVDTFSMLPVQLRPEELVPASRPVSSRAAENLFWMGRYTERAENDVRLATVALTWLNSDEDNAGELFAAVDALCQRSGLVPAAPTLSVRMFEATLVAELAGGPTQGGVARNLGALAFAAGQIRDRLSPEHWRLVVTAHEGFMRMASGGKGGEPGVPESGSGSDTPPMSAPDVLRGLKSLGMQLSAITGSQTDRMTRDDGWRLLTIGRQIERLSAMAGLLGALFRQNAVLGDSGFNMLLDLFDSKITYRAYYPGRQEVPALLNLLMREPANPRSLACVLNVLRKEVARLPDTVAGPATDLVRLLPEDGVGVTLAELCGQHQSQSQSQSQTQYGGVLALTAQLEDAASALSNAISLRYFSHAAGHDQTLSA